MPGMTRSKILSREKEDWDPIRTLWDPNNIPKDYQLQDFTIEMLSLEVALGNITKEWVKGQSHIHALSDWKYPFMRDGSIRANGEAFGRPWIDPEGKAIVFLNAHHRLPLCGDGVLLEPSRWTVETITSSPGWADLKSRYYDINQRNPLVYHHKLENIKREEGEEEEGDRDKIIKLKEQVATLTGEVAGLEAKVPMQDADIEVARMGASKIKDQVSTFTGEVATLKATISIRDYEIVELKASVDRLKGHSEDILKEEVNSFQTTLGHLMATTIAKIENVPNPDARACALRRLKKYLGDVEQQSSKAIADSAEKSGELVAQLDARKKTGAGNGVSGSASSNRDGAPQDKSDAAAPQARKRTIDNACFLESPGKRLRTVGNSNLKDNRYL